jgi:hypothetical protein
MNAIWAFLISVMVGLSLFAAWREYDYQRSTAALFSRHHYMAGRINGITKVETPDGTYELWPSGFVGHLRSIFGLWDSGEAIIYVPPKRVPHSHSIQSMTDDTIYLKP